MSTTPYDRRKARIEAQVIHQVATKGGFSIFWATETQERARAIDRLEKAGTITARKGKAYGKFPWCGYRAANKRKDSTP